MKIAHVVHTSLDSSQGGIATYLRNIVPIQEQLGNEVEVYTNGKYPQHGQYSTPIKSFNFFSKFKKLEPISHSLKANLKLSLTDADVIHYHLPVSGIFSFIPLLFDKKRVLTLHGRPDLGRDFSPRTQQILRSINKVVFPQMNEITCVTKNLQDYLGLEHNIDSRFIPHGFDVNNLDSNSYINKLGLNKNEYILFVGRLVEKKGADTLIEAYSQMNTDKKLVIVGGESYKTGYEGYLNELAKGNGNILFTGSLFGDELREIYLNASIFVSGLEKYGLPLTVLEAIGSRVPVVSSDFDDQIPVYNYTHRFRNKDSANLARTLENVLANDNLRLQFVDSALEHCLDNYSWDNVASEFNLMYNRVRNKRRVCLDM